MLLPGGSAPDHDLEQAVLERGVEASGVDPRRQRDGPPKRSVAPLADVVGQVVALGRTASLTRDPELPLQSETSTSSFGIPASSQRMTRFCPYA